MRNRNTESAKCRARAISVSMLLTLLALVPLACGPGGFPTGPGTCNIDPESFGFGRDDQRDFDRCRRNHVFP